MALTLAHESRRDVLCDGQQSAFPKATTKGDAEEVATKAN